MTDPEKPVIADYHSELQNRINAEGRGQIKGHIAAGRLPPNFYFRMNVIGYCQTDWQQKGKALAHNILRDCAQYAGQPENIREDSQKLAYGDLPEMVIDWSQEANQEIYPQFETMYYGLDDLARAVKRLRFTRGDTMTAEDQGNDWRAREAEWARCVGLSRPIWRILVNRRHPDWLTDPEPYYLPTIRFDQVYYAKKRTMTYSVIGATVISDAYIHTLYEEAITTGIKGVAQHGIDSLGELLADEHPELHPMAH